MASTICLKYQADLASENLPPLLEQSIQLTARRHLEHQVHSLLIVKEAVKPQDVHVPTVRLDLDLSPQLVLNSVLDELGLVQHLQCEDEAGAALPRNVDRSELP
eukprot:CAMPEP_0170584280 /NCGR_PEP_ID=MMETSP0224-20130122/8606_1 /TAXON_ID=285029 /ORGANISM="Togula jolla, Strain CCCM 725" /LENGTH=103 /DNA_ID=CAMNT_0010907707 /DNA_START=713 /DNA_END=1023 /DNA_ORIENTATION=-